MADPIHIYCNNHAVPIIAEDHVLCIKHIHIVDIMTKSLARNLGIKD
jgi:hypothetical protein